MSGTGSDIAVAPNGTVWVLSSSCNSTGCDFYDSANKGASFTQVSALAVDIAVDANNITWVMNAAGSLYKATDATASALSGSSPNLVTHRAELSPDHRQGALQRNIVSPPSAKPKGAARSCLRP